MRRRAPVFKVPPPFDAWMIFDYDGNVGGLKESDAASRGGGMSQFDRLCQHGRRPPQGFQSSMVVFQRNEIDAVCISEAPYDPANPPALHARHASTAWALPDRSA